FVTSLLSGCLDEKTIDFVETVFPKEGWGSVPVLNMMREANKSGVGQKDVLEFIANNMVKIVGAKGSDGPEILRQCGKIGSSLIEAINGTHDNEEIKERVRMMADTFAIYQRGLVAGSDEHTLAETQSAFVKNMVSCLGEVKEPRVFRYMAKKFVGGLDNLVDEALSVGDYLGFDSKQTLKKSIESAKEDVEKRALISKMKNYIFTKADGVSKMFKVMDAFDADRSLLKDEWFIDVIKSEQSDVRFSKLMRGFSYVSDSSRVEKDDNDKLAFLGNFTARIKKSPTLWCEIAGNLIEGNHIEHPTCKELLTGLKEFLATEWSQNTHEKEFFAKKELIEKFNYYFCEHEFTYGSLPSQATPEQLELCIDLGFDVNRIYFDESAGVGGYKNFVDNIDHSIGCLNVWLKPGVNDDDDVVYMSEGEMSENLERLYDFRESLIPYFDAKEYARLQVLRGEMDYSEAHDKTGLSVNEYGKDDCTLFLNCFNINDQKIESPNLDVIKQLIEAGADVNLPIKEFDEGKPIDVSALHMIANRVKAKNGKEIAEAILDAGANINAVAFENWTSLHCAANEGNIAVAEILLERGADLSIKSIDGKTAKDFALEEDRHGVVQAIEFHEAKRESELLQSRMTQLPEETNPKRKQKL
ncbi:MAG TPA: ankyrin repeat domain-containing protein, partial [Anaerovoracaceae bacterium]|nr:ankyrin repeat domain-containing protein [Anaerovoracaceae bacterium]